MQNRINWLVVIGFWVLPLITNSYADELPPVILHTQIKEVKYPSTITFTCFVIDNNRVKDVILYYKNEQDLDYKKINMKKENHLYQVTLEQEEIYSNKISYFIQTEDEYGNISYEPKNFTAYKINIKGFKEKEKKVGVKTKPIGSYTIGIQHAEATSEYAAALPYELMEIQPRTNKIFNLNTTQQHYEKTFSLTTYREIEPYTNRIRDNFSFSIYEKDSEFKLGNFYLDFSELTLKSKILSGISIKKENAQLFFARSKRSQERTKNLQAQFRQYIYGAQFKTKDTKWTFLHQFDDSTSISNWGNLRPIENTLIGAQFEKELKNKINTGIELSKNMYDDDTTDKIEAVDDYAYKLYINQVGEDEYWNAIYNFSIAYKRIGTNFLSGAELLSSMDNDKEGIFIVSNLQLIDKLGVNLRYERYDDNLNKSKEYTTKTNDGSISIDIKQEKLPSVSLNYSKTKREADTIITSTRKGLSLSYTLPSVASFGDTIINSSYNRIDYDSASITLDIDMLMLFINTSYKDLFTLFYSYNRINTDEIITTKKQTKNTIHNLGLLFNVIPLKFTIQPSYKEIINKKSDATVDNIKKEYEIKYNYNLTTERILSFDLKLIDYKDYFNKNNFFNEQVAFIKLTQLF